MSDIIQAALKTFFSEYREAADDMQHDNQVLSDALLKKAQTLGANTRSLFSKSEADLIVLGKRYNRDNQMMHFCNSMLDEDYFSAQHYAQGMIADEPALAGPLNALQLEQIAAPHANIVAVIEYLRRIGNAQSLLQNSIRLVGRSNSPLSERCVGARTHQQVLEKQPEFILEAVGKVPVESLAADAELKEKVEAYTTQVKAYVEQFQALNLAQYIPKDGKYL